MIDNALMFNIEMQTAVVKSLLNPDILTRCHKIIKTDYFAKELKVKVKVILDFFNEHNTVVPLPIIQAYIFKDHIDTPLTESAKKSLLSIIEKFCKHSEVRKVLNDAAELLETGDYAAIETRMRNAVTISLDTDAGNNYYDTTKTEKRIYDLTHITTEALGYAELDTAFEGGIGRKELFLILAKSSGGKSLMMLNIGCNYNLRGMNVYYISLEMSEDIVMQRYDSLISGKSKREVIDGVQSLIVDINNVKPTAGSFYVKRLPQGADSHAIKNCIRSYELEVGDTPDVVIIDYIDLMSPNSSKSDNQFIREKYIAEEVREVFNEFNVVGISASQYNRDAYKMEGVEDVNNSHISGGLSKINTADNVIALWQDESDFAKSEYLLKVMKSRNSGAKDQMFRLAVNPTSLRITDKHSTTQARSILSLGKK